MREKTYMFKYIYREKKSYKSNRVKNINIYAEQNCKQLISLAKHALDKITLFTFEAKGLLLAEKYSTYICSYEYTT